MTDTTGMDDFYEDDEPVEDIRAAFESGEKGVTRRPDRAAAENFRGDDLSVEELREIVDRGVHPVETVPLENRKLVITLTTGPAGFTRGLADQMGASIPETVRRALTLLNVVLSLDPDEELTIRNRKTNALDRVRFNWGDELPPRPTTFPHAEIDHEVSATYVYLRPFDHETEPRLRTREMPTGGMGIMLNVDINADGKAVGVEIL